jgi:hypothetical protein
MGSKNPGAPVTQQNEKERRPGFLQSAQGQATLFIVGIILVVFVSMVLQLL